jgi:hypothetical protein
MQASKPRAVQSQGHLDLFSILDIATFYMAGRGLRFYFRYSTTGPTRDARTSICLYDAAATEPPYSSYVGATRCAQPHAGVKTARRYKVKEPAAGDAGKRKTLFITDAAINIFPDLDTKRDIIQNVIDLFTQVGLGTPRVAILSAVETVTSKIPSTIEAAALCKMAERGQINGGLLDLPLAFDNAVSPEAAAIKGIKSEVAGRAQILVVPDLEAGNMLAKNLAFMAKANTAGIVLGARVPIVLTSRADSVRSRLASCAARRPLCRRTSTCCGTAGGLIAMDTILIVNAGSSSVKFQIFGIEGAGALHRLIKGQSTGSARGRV